jgi:hypothetical protein
MATGTDTGRNVGRDAGRNMGRDTGRNAGRDTGRDMGRDTGMGRAYEGETWPDDCVPDQDVLVQAQTFTLTETASGLACFPDHSPPT